MRIGPLEERVAIRFAHAWRGLINDLSDKIPPPIFVVILARAFDGRARRHSLPASGEGVIESRSIEGQSAPFPDESVVMPNAFRQMNECAGGIERDQFDHGASVLVVTEGMGLFRTGELLANIVWIVVAALDNAMSDGY